MFFSSGTNAVFISHNFDNPGMAVFLKKADELAMKKNDPIYTNVQEAKEGELKRLNERVRRAHPEMFHRPIPMLVGGPGGPLQMDRRRMETWHRTVHRRR